MTLASEGRRARLQLRIMRRHRAMHYKWIEDKLTGQPMKVYYRDEGRLHKRTDGLLKNGYSWTSYKTRRRRYTRS